jgi:hypothetical protein
VTDASATITDRARAYLQTNCSNCHLPGGPVGTSMDLRYITTFQGTNTCDVVPTRTNLGLSDPRIIDPGFPGNSILYLRVTDTGSNRMPPLGTSLVHQDAAALLQSWITNLAGCQ